MKKFLFTCFLALPCLPVTIGIGSAFSAQSQVAESPPEPPFHRSAVPVSPHSGDPHRGGEARPDTFQGSYKSFSLASITKPESESFRLEANAESTSDIRHWTSDIKLNFGLVDSDQDMRVGFKASILKSPSVPVFRNQDSSGREAYSQSTEAQSLGSNFLCLASKNSSLHHEIDGGPSLVDRTVPLENGISPMDLDVEGERQLSAETFPVVIYGEIINPDSLGPLVLTSSPYFVDANSQFGQVIQEINPVRGEFFDGVLNQAVRKFAVKVDLSDRLGYFSLHAGGRTLFENFLLIPGDSLKVNLDLQNFQISFAGKHAAFYELQYLLAREADREVFDSPRQLVLSHSSAILKKEENIAKWEFFKNQFGSQLKVVSGTKESLQNQWRQLAYPEEKLAFRLEYLDFFKEKMDSGLWDYIRMDLMSKHYRGVIASIRNFSLDLLEEEYAEVESDSIAEKLIWELENLKGLESSDQVKLVSQGFLGMEIERQTLLAVLKGISFLTQLESQYSGELADRIKAGFLSRFLKQYPDPSGILTTYLKEMSFEPWMARVESLKRSTIPGEQFMDLSFRNLEGKKVSSTSFGGKPTLLYVYFSTCSHSADYFHDYLFPLYEETHDLGYQLIALSVDEDEALWKSRLDKFSDPSIPNLNISGPQKEAFVQTYEVFGFPKVFLLDETGKITAFKIEGYDQKSMKDFVLANLGLSSNPKTNPLP